MKHLVALLIPALCLDGCVSKYQITSPQQYSEINAQGEDYRATITIQAQSRTGEYEGDRVTVGPSPELSRAPNGDSVQWLDPRRQVWRSAPIANLRRIRFTKPAKGAAEGAAIGAIPGAIFLIPFAILTANASGEAQSIDRIMSGIALSGLVGGAAIGAIIGVLVGHKTDYVPAPAQPTKSSTTAPPLISPR